MSREPHKFSRILIANRGEIALRIIRACKEMGIESVCVYSTADKDARYLRLADHAVCIGPPVSSESYLAISRIIAAAELADVDAIHPGYGFLSENAHFAEVCASCHITFIGPSPSSMSSLGDKESARALARKVGVPLLPGSDGLVDSEEKAVSTAARVGYPVIIKASAGGGGRGMRVAHNEITLIQGYHAARAEAEKAFGNGAVFIEKYLENPRHIEIQFIRDTHGNGVYLGDRDCTLQRRHQKLVEEAPSSFLDDSIRQKMGEAALRLVEEANYHSVGTAEFLVDAKKNFYFLEVNTRIQVEHTVTEMITGLDLIQEQIKVAMGESLGYRQQDIRLTGHAIECRINAENPDNNFSPSPGKISLYVPPGGKDVRLDSHIYGGYVVPSNYDSLLAKLIVHRPTRAEAIRTMLRALDEMVIEGIHTTIGLHKQIFQHRNFITGDIDTGFIERVIRPRNPSRKEP
ncbi:MAG: acetyl-CoA carboxylase biotin carboxylase subunit [Planctomycetota bacterium]